MGAARGKIIVAAFLLSLLFSCKKEDCNCITPPTGERSVMIACEGSLGNGNSAMDIYHPERDSMYENVYGIVNGQPLGDVFQGVAMVNDKYFLSINNSDKIAVVGKEYNVITTTTVSKPRYILPVGTSKAYVSSLFSDKMYILNTDNNSISGSITIPANNPEGMLWYSNNNVLVCPWDTANDMVYMIDINTDSITDSIQLAGRAPQEAVMDAENKLWVLAGNVAKGKPATLTRIDPGTKQILKTYYFPADADPMKPVFNNTRDMLYFIEVNYTSGTQHNGIYRMNIHDADLPPQPFIAAQQFQYFWALGISPWNGDIYVGDPRGFIQKGSMLIYSADGVLKKQYNTGVGPGHFYFFN